MRSKEITVQLIKHIFNLDQELGVRTHSILWMEVVGTYTKNVGPSWEVVAWMTNDLARGCRHSKGETCTEKTSWDGTSSVEGDDEVRKEVLGLGGT